MKAKALLLTALTTLVLLSGCADSGDTETDSDEVVDKESFELKAGKGAIAGLLVDDRFRPIHLTDDPTTEFQAEGFILLQETGQQVKSNENGEFTFVDLEPGQYTLRVTASGHEATPQKVSVEEGVFNEKTLIARRVVNEGGVIVTEEYTAFVPCQASAVAATAQCIVVPPDNSGDTDRQDFWTNYTDLNATWVVIEMLSNKDAARDGALKVVARNATNDCYVVNDVITEGNYLKTWLQNGEVSPFDVEDRNCRWTNEDEQLVQIWAQGLFKEESQAVFSDGTCTAGAYCSAESRGIGPQAGLVVRFLISIFIGEPDEDPTTYCKLCPE